MRNLKWVKRVKWAMAGVGLACLTAASVRAQARQPFSAQLSGIYMSVAGDPYEGTNAGPGVEAQIRWNVPGRFGGFSLGGGFQRTSHSLDRPDTDLVLTGFFLEPRFVLAGSFFGSERFAPYLAPRITLLTQRYNADDFDGSTGGLSGNLGAGLLYRLNRRANIDAGATIGYTTIRDERVTDRETQAEFNLPSGSGVNLMTRVGVAFSF
ncbi:MAG: outer membrane beta-barrel protein [Gemmatimonadaceae bacterium]